jgi:hypothetical protein
MLDACQAGSTMVVRAVRDIPAGEELTVSYLGREELAPAPVRQKLLHDRYGSQHAGGCGGCSDTHPLCMHLMSITGYFLAGLQVRVHL